MRRIRFKDFDMKRGIITIRKEVAKTHRRRVVTIPKAVLHYFIDPFFSSHPTNYLIFGKGLKPHPLEPVAVNRMCKDHKKVLKILQERGELKDITGIHHYSWKDTGVKHMCNHVSPHSLRDQLGHASLDQTMVYYKADEVNQEIRDLPDDLT